MLDSFAQLFQHPRTHITHGLQKSYGLHPSHYALQPNIVGNAHHCQRCWLNIVGSWPCSRGSKTNPNFQLVNKPSAGAVLRDQSTRSFTVVIANTVYHLFVKNKKGGGGGGFLTRERELINFLPLKSEGELIREGGLIEDLRYSDLMFFSLRFVGTRRHVWLSFFHISEGKRF